MTTGDFSMMPMDQAVLLGVDYGRRRVGLAVSDALGIAAYPLGAVDVHGDDHAVSEIAARAAEHRVQGIVLGLPLSMNGAENDMAREVRAFAALLEARTALPVDLVDERLTTDAAHTLLKDAGIKASKRKAHADTLAALLILETALARRRAETAQDGP